MRSNLSVGLDVAKGLALAWRVPLVAVHHMQAHALTPRFCYTLRATGDEAKILHESPILTPGAPKEAKKSIEWDKTSLQPQYPFLSVLASGGHTMLIESSSLINHRMLAETGDIAIGDCLDKAARAILPLENLQPPYGKALEDFGFPAGQNSATQPDLYAYTPPARRRDELERRVTRWGWSLGPPLSESKGGQKSSRRMVYSFAGLLSSVQRLMAGEEGAGRNREERRGLAREVMRVAFEHLASRILLCLTSMKPEREAKISTVVISGGVASNTFLRHVVRSILDVRGYEHIELDFPPPELCTDNALMIAWAGMEMYDEGYKSALEVQAIRKWGMDPEGEDGGILGVGGWGMRRD